MYAEAPIGSFAAGGAAAQPSSLVFHSQLVATPALPQKAGEGDAAEPSAVAAADADGGAVFGPAAPVDEHGVQTQDVYAHASEQLVAARGVMAALSFERAAARLAATRRRYADVDALDRETHAQYLAIMVRRRRATRPSRPPADVVTRSSLPFAPCVCVTGDAFRGAVA